LHNFVIKFIKGKHIALSDAVSVTHKCHQLDTAGAII